VPDSASSSISRHNKFQTNPYVAMSSIKRSDKRQVRLSREEPFPCWAWYGLGLFTDLKEADRKPFRRWLLKKNKGLPEAEKWPFKQLQIPKGYERREEIFALKDHFNWALKVAFAKTAVHGKKG
jgi:hypothetical protein